MKTGGQDKRSGIAGVGLGLRSKHVSEIISTRPPIPWFEVLTDNYFGEGGPPLAELEAVSSLYPITMHSVGMSLGSTNPLDVDYLKRIKVLVERFKPAWISEHLCWTSVHGVHLHDLLPLPYTPETVRHVVERILQIQDFFQDRLVIENVSSYLCYNHSTLTEWEFVGAVANEADCALLLDINNVYVSSINHGFDPLRYFQGLPLARIREIHLGGFEDRGEYLLDAHGSEVHEAVWNLYEQALQMFGPVPTLLEWDNNIPSLDILLREAKRANDILDLFETGGKALAAS